MSQLMRVPDAVYEQASEIAKARDMSMKEAVRMMCRDGDYDV